MSIGDGKDSSEEVTSKLGTDQEKPDGMGKVTSARWSHKYAKGRKCLQCELRAESPASAGTNGWGDSSQRPEWTEVSTQRVSLPLLSLVFSQLVRGSLWQGSRSKVWSGFR